MRTKRLILKNNIGMYTNRLRYIDFAKGVAILFVVMGHMVQYNLKGDSANVVFNFIYSFHMPLFFFLSGYVSALKYEGICKKNALTFIKKKFLSLLVPFFTWGIFFNLLLSRFTISDCPLQLKLLVMHPARGLWFLFTLFIIQTAYLSVRLCVTSFKKHQQLAECFFVILFIVLIGIIGIKTHKNFFNPYYSFAFFAGYYYKKQFDGECKKYILFVSFVTFVILSSKFDFYMSGGKEKMIIGLLASLLMVQISKQSIIIFPSKCKIIEWIGQNTLEIYVTNILITQVVNDSIDTEKILPVPLFVIVLLVSVFAAIIMVEISKIIASIPYLKLLAFGKK